MFIPDAEGIIKVDSLTASLSIKCMYLRKLFGDS